MDLFRLIKTLSETTGISGHETAVGSVVRQELRPFVDEVHIDKMGSVVALKRGNGKRRRRILLAAHMDEIGLMVSGIEMGFLRVAGVGSVDPRVMLAQEVIVHAQREVPGVVASLPPHLQAETHRKKTTPIDQLWIDVGLSESQARRLIRIGDLVSMRRQVTQLQNGLLAGKAFDNRVSVAALAVCLEALASRRHAWDVLAVATVQEETTLLGATTSAFKHRPDAVVAVDVTYGVQNGSSEVDAFPLGSGPTVGVGPNIHPLIADKMRQVAIGMEVEVRTEVMPGASGTDAWAMQVVREGIPCGLLSIPLRSMHTPVETVSVKDVERTGRLLASFCAGLDEAFYQSLTSDQ